MGERIGVTSREVTGFFTLFLSAWWSVIPFIAAFDAQSSWPGRRGPPATAAQAFVAGLVPAVVAAAAWGLAVWIASRWWPRLRGRWALLCAGAMAVFMGSAALVGAYQGYTAYGATLDR
ncbi:MAG TPA: hypothetical protein VEZ47_08935 [Gemmatirosa sp.]|nr:hypothetical protein [Gemmatirosa sp.]